jgi:hypothetical protein
VVGQHEGKSGVLIEIASQQCRRHC